MTVHVQFTQGVLTGVAAGTGILLSSDGEVLTNAHVVQNAISIQVTVNGAGSRAAHVVRTNPSADIAPLRISGVRATAAPGSSADVHVGDDVVAIGNATAAGILHGGVIGDS